MMERALKERIIGAAVLVLVVVLVVPVFLDGPPGDDEIVSKSVPLPGQAEQKTQTVVLDRDRKEPVPSATNNASAQDTPKPQPAPQQQKPDSEPVAQKPAPEPVVEQQPAGEPPAATPDASTTGMWAVQLGSFSNQQNADALAANLRKQGFAAFLSKLTTSSGELHRVRVGPQKDRASAEAMAAQLKKAGHDGKVLPHP